MGSSHNRALYKYPVTYIPWTSSAECCSGSLSVTPRGCSTEVDVWSSSVRFSTLETNVKESETSVGRTSPVCSHRHKEGIQRHQTPPRYRKATSYVSPYGPLPPYVTSSIKPEVRNVSQRRQRRTEPWPQGICTEKFVKIGPAVSEICSRTDTQTK